MALSFLASKLDDHGPIFSKKKMPKFPKQNSELLCDLVSNNHGTHLMYLLQIDDRVLEEPVESWIGSPAYQASLAKGLMVMSYVIIDQ